MQVIEQYPLIMSDYQVLYIPQGAELLHVEARSSGQIFLYALIRQDVTLRVPRAIRMYGTGSLIENASKLSYVGSVHPPMSSTNILCHIFDDGERD